MQNIPEIDNKIIEEHGLSSSEYKQITNILGRDPNYVELGIFSVMWSEHCSYKSSIKMLKTFPRDGEVMLVGAGEENAGIVDIGNDMALTFKIESHNHPSAIEPYQGAATGVGGIVRDIFAMGARPVALLNSLRFGPVGEGRNKYIFEFFGYGFCGAESILMQVSRWRRIPRHFSDFQSVDKQIYYALKYVGQ